MDDVIIGESCEKKTEDDDRCDYLGLLEHAPQEEKKDRPEADERHKSQFSRKYMTTPIIGKKSLYYAVRMHHLSF